MHDPDQPCMALVIKENTIQLQNKTCNARFELLCEMSIGSPPQMTHDMTSSLTSTSLPVNDVGSSSNKPSSVVTGQSTNKVTTPGPTQSELVNRYVLRTTSRTPLAVSHRFSGHERRLNPVSTRQTSVMSIYHVTRPIATSAVLSHFGKTTCLSISKLSFVTINSIG